MNNFKTKILGIQPDGEDDQHIYIDDRHLSTGILCFWKYPLNAYFCHGKPYPLTFPSGVWPPPWPSPGGGGKRCPDGGTGRRAGLKNQWGNSRAGSIPAQGTI